MEIPKAKFQTPNKERKYQITNTKIKTVSNVPNSKDSEYLNFKFVQGLEFGFYLLFGI